MLSDNAWEMLPRSSCLCKCLTFANSANLVRTYNAKNMRHAQEQIRLSI
jgi:hypothetical protein